MTNYKNHAIISLMRLNFAIAVMIGLSSCFNAEAGKCNKNPIKIAVLDTGFGYKNQGHEANLCMYGHKDFTVDRQFTKEYATKTPIPTDINGHGTNIVGVIEAQLKKSNVNYCIVVIKYYSDSQTGAQNLLSSIRAINYAGNIKANYINYSGGGESQSKFEEISVKRYINGGGQFVAAAGNEGRTLDLPDYHYFPAMYDSREIVVGNTCKDGLRCKTSNYGNPVNRWEIGDQVFGYGLIMSGTSQATATATGKLVIENMTKCDIGR